MCWIYSNQDSWSKHHYILTGIMIEKVKQLQISDWSFLMPWITIIWTELNWRNLITALNHTLLRHLKLHGMNWYDKCYVPLNLVWIKVGISLPKVWGINMRICHNFLPCWVSTITTYKNDSLRLSTVREPNMRICHNFLTWYVLAQHSWEWFTLSQQFRMIHSLSIQLENQTWEYAIISYHDTSWLTVENDSLWLSS